LELYYPLSVVLVIKLLGLEETGLVAELLLDQEFSLAVALSHPQYLMIHNFCQIYAPSNFIYNVPLFIHNVSTDTYYGTSDYDNTAGKDIRGSLSGYYSGHHADKTIVNLSTCKPILNHCI
jgi:hypothetical protein